MKYQFNFKYNLDRSTKRIGSQASHNIYKFDANIEKLYNYIQKKLTENPELSVSDLEDLLLSKVDSLTDYSKTNFAIFPLIARLNAAKYLSKNLETLKQLELNGAKADPLVYGNSFEEDCENLATEMSNAYTETMNNYRKANSSDISFMEKTNTAELIKIFNRMSPIQKRNYLTVMGYVKQGLPAFLTDYIPTLEQECKKVLISSLCSCFAELNDLNVIDSYIQTYNAQMEQLNTPSFKILKEDSFIKSISEYDSCKSSSSLVQLLNSQSLENLIYMNTFWINRLEKETQDFTDAIFYTHKLDLLSKWVKGQKDFGNLSNAEKENLLIGCNLLSFPTSCFYQESDLEVLKDKNPLKESDDKNSFVLVSVDNFIDETQQNFGKDYESYFSEIFPNFKHSLSEDLRLYQKLYNPIHLQYSYKDKNIQSALICLTQSQNANWGISKQNGETFLPTEKWSTISIDTNLNYPLRFHAPTELLRDFLVQYQGTTKIPVYLGVDDFLKPNGRLTTTQILLPFAEHQKNNIKKLSKEFPNNAFISHLNYLRDLKRFPEHLKIDSVKPNGKVEKVIPSYFVDLNSGEYLKLDKSGNYIPFEFNTKNTKTDHSFPYGEGK